MPVNSLHAAMVAARKNVRNPKFDSTNPHFRNKFASLKAINSAVIDAFLEEGICISQELVSSDEGGVGCVTHFLHESGEKLSLGPFIIRPTKNDPQGAASATTYARRYALQAACGVVGDDDDDGNAASESPFKTKQMKTKCWTALKDAAAEDDALKARETWTELTTDQQKDLWHELSSGQRSTLKKLLAEDEE